MLKRFLRWLVSPIFKPVAGLSEAVGKWFSDRGFTANQMTLIGMLLCLPMCIGFWWEAMVIGATLMAISLLTDFFDGAIAKYQEKLRKEQGLLPMTLEEELRLTLWERINFRGSTHLGTVLDPFVDKTRYFPVLFLLGFGFVQTWNLLSQLGVALILTAIRPIKQHLKLGSGKSNKLGKSKIWVEVLVMSLLVLLPRNHISFWIINTLCVLALIGGLASLGGHVLTGILAYRRRERLPLPGPLGEVDPD